MTYCERLQQFLVENGAAALRDDAEAQQHLVDCTSCFDFLEALEQVDTTLARMPEHDAPEALVMETLAAITGAAPPAAAPATPPPLPAKEKQPSRMRRVLARLGRVLAWLWGIASFAWLRQRFAQRTEAAQKPAVGQTAGDARSRWRRLLTNPKFLIPATAAPSSLLLVSGLVFLTARGDSPLAENLIGESDRFDREITLAAPESEVEPSSGELADDDGVAADKTVRLGSQRKAEVKKRFRQMFDESAGSGSVLGGGGGGVNGNGVNRGVIGTGPVPRPPAPSVARTKPMLVETPAADLADARDYDQNDPRDNLVPLKAVIPHAGAKDQIEDFKQRSGKSERKRRRDVTKREEMQGELLPEPALTGAVMPFDVEPEPQEPEEEELSRATTDTPAGDFLAERNRTLGLTFKRADGYWANTYVPGDPAMRLLKTRLERTDRTVLGSLRLDRAARQYAQPFDTPTTSALDVYVHADEAGMEGESRMLVQVGIKGTPRRSRSRPTMNVGVVLDLSGAPGTEQQNAMRALIMALGEARDIGDRFSLVVAGRPGALVVPSDAFKHGPLTVAMRALLGGSSTGPTLSLTEAAEQAIGIVVGDDDPTTPLGSSVVIVVTPNTIGFGDLRVLTEMAHESAVNGVPISTVGVGPSVSVEQLDQITLAGQGNRRLLSAPAEAGGLVDRELSSVSRVIARAVRLRIRLAPGVKLVDVVGSHRLDEIRAEKVRQAEQSIDRRMSKNLGVASDRGEDEDGIQIVIPSYYAGDTHVILLDVVAPGPGPIADVRMRYKDLVFLKNGVSRANLTVKRGNLRAGPLELNVLKNLLARRVSAALERAGNLLNAGDAAGAQRVLEEQSQLLAGLTEEIPALTSDRDLLADIRMLDEYTRVLTTVAHGQPRAYVVDSLRYAAFLKVLPRPVEN